MPIQLTVNGTRKLPFEVSEEVLSLLRNSNSELRIVLIASPVAVENPLSQDDEPVDPHFKIKALYVETIETNT